MLLFRTCTGECRQGTGSTRGVRWSTRERTTAELERWSSWMKKGRQRLARRSSTRQSLPSVTHACARTAGGTAVVPAPPSPSPSAPTEPTHEPSAEGKLRVGFSRACARSGAEGSTALNGVRPYHAML
eukprot:1185625-Prorocentrum_minimum.AAC.3